MELVFDSCALINVINGNALGLILSIPQCQFYIGNLVYDECCMLGTQELMINNSIKEGSLNLIQEDADIYEFTSIKNKYHLGDGESESIIHCKRFNYILLTDDRKARKSGKKELGNNNVKGSLFMLKESVRKKMIGCEDAIQSYKTMIAKGGFLPNIDERFLCE
jgi:predicted nucleic acid-binding protein